MAAPFPSPTSKWHSEKYDSISPSRPELSAKGKTVLVTGGGTGIGAETALYFAQASASRIALLGRREQPLLDTKATIEQRYPGVDVFVASTDITKKSEVDAAFVKFLGDAKLDVLISNAALTGPLEGVREVDVEAFMNGIQANLGGALHVAKAFLRHAATDAVVVDVNSSAAHMNFADKFASYSAAKLSVFRLWDHVSFNNPKMSIFHIQPGIVDTAMNREAGGIAATGIEDNGKSENRPVLCNKE
jgi:NAD(P)-dependent dehydrogenase (short-subunit alcohol dehydrogenase family)